MLMTHQHLPTFINKGKNDWHYKEMACVRHGSTCTYYIQCYFRLQIFTCMCALRRQRSKEHAVSISVLYILYIFVCVQKNQGNINEALHSKFIKLKCISRKIKYTFEIRSFVFLITKAQGGLAPVPFKGQLENDGGQDWSPQVDVLRINGSRKSSDGNGDAAPLRGAILQCVKAGWRARQAAEEQKSLLHTLAEVGQRRETLNLFSLNLLSLLHPPNGHFMDV